MMTSTDQKKNFMSVACCMKTSWMEFFRQKSRISLSVVSCLVSRSMKRKPCP